MLWWLLRPRTPLLLQALFLCLQLLRLGLQRRLWLLHLRCIPEVSRQWSSSHMRMCAQDGFVAVQFDAIVLLDAIKYYLLLWLCLRAAGCCWLLLVDHDEPWGGLHRNEVQQDCDATRTAEDSRTSSCC